MSKLINNSNKSLKSQKEVCSPEITKRVLRRSVTKVSDTKVDEKKINVREKRKTVSKSNTVSKKLKVEATNTSVVEGGSPDAKATTNRAGQIQTDRPKATEYEKKQTEDPEKEKPDANDITMSSSSEIDSDESPLNAALLRTAKLQKDGPNQEDALKIQMMKTIILLINKLQERIERDRDENMIFLLCLLGPMKSMNTRQRGTFQVHCLKLIHSILYKNFTGNADLD